MTRLADHFWSWPSKNTMTRFIKNHFIPSNTVNFIVPSPDWRHPFFTMTTQNYFNHLLICMDLYELAKNQLILSVHSWGTVNYRVLRPNRPHPFLTIPSQTFFDQLIIFVNLYLHAKKWEIVDLQILQSDWLRIFWPITQDKSYRK